MSRSTSSDRLGRWDYYTNRPHKKFKYSRTSSETSVIEDDADSSTKMSRSIKTTPESNQWVVTRYLGKCSHSYVYLAESTIEGDEDNLPFEMIIKSTEMSQALHLMNEIKFLSCLKSPFVVSFYGQHITVETNEKDPLGKIMYYNTMHEYCPGQNLVKHIRRQKGKLPEDDVKRFASDILFGLKCIHEEKIIHCDIKPKNILLAVENKRFGSVDGFAAKISGLGKAITKGSIEYGEGLGHMRGTAKYLSPEVMMDMVLDYGADVWAFGCTVLEMLTGERVLSEFGKLDWEGWKTLIGKSGIVPYIPDYLSEKAKDFLTKCLERDPAKRWSVDTLLKHQFLKWNDEEEEEEETYEEEEEERYEIEEEAYEYFYDEIGDANVEAYEAYEANLEAEAAFEVEEAIEIDEEYPQEDSEDGL